ncbi:hypothetical protein E2C01_040810 [Portunus trituberculatus]|uniref:Uncharacterized protein n=1 Tax=Portunus trituberculatus TaxID=210409 RepID=A0A5B7FNK7_PORTR|nr:hypothetical protein [Portunus trituberculatus]
MKEKNNDLPNSEIIAWKLQQKQRHLAPLQVTRGKQMAGMGISGDTHASQPNPDTPTSKHYCQHQYPFHPSPPCPAPPQSPPHSAQRLILSPSRPALPSSAQQPYSHRAKLHLLTFSCW